MSFRASAISGIKWSSASHFGRRVIALGTTVVLSRLLTPSDFGLVAMAAVITGFVELFRDMGTATAIVQRQEKSEVLWSSVFWMNAVFGLAAFVSLWLLAPTLGQFYREENVVPILRALSISFLIAAFGILQQTLLERRLAFETLAKIEVSSAFAAATVGICAAFLGQGAWSLVYRVLASNVTTTSLLWLKAGWRPQFILRWSELRSIMGFSLNLTTFNVFNYFSRNADNFLIGRYLGAVALGPYDLAYSLMLYPLQGISSVIGRVMFPLYSRIQEDLARFRQAYLSIAWSIAFVSFPLMFGLMVVREPLVLTVFGEKWRPVTDLLLFFAPLGAIQSVGTTVGAIYEAKGRTDWLLRWGVATGTLMVLAFWIGIHWGVNGVAAACVTVYLLIAYPAFAIPFKLIDLRVAELGRVLWRPLVCSLLMAASVTLVAWTLPRGHGWLILSIQVGAGVIAYPAFSWMLNRKQMLTLMSVLRGHE